MYYLSFKNKPTQCHPVSCVWSRNEVSTVYITNHIKKRSNLLKSIEDTALYQVSSQLDIKYLRAEQLKKKKFNWLFIVIETLWQSGKVILVIDN